MERDGTGVGEINDFETPGELYRHLRQNAQFRIAVDARVKQLTSPGQPLYVNPQAPAFDPLTPENNLPASLYMSRFEQIQSALLTESARWGDNRKPDDPYTIESYEVRLAEVLRHLEQRSDVFAAQF